MQNLVLLWVTSRRGGRAGDPDGHAGKHYVCRLTRGEEEAKTSLIHTATTEPKLGG